MSEVNVYSGDDDELDWLLNNIQLVELEPGLDSGDDNNTCSSVNASQVPLFVTVRPPTEEPLSGMDLALDEGSSAEKCAWMEVYSNDQPCLHKTRTQAL